MPPAQSRARKSRHGVIAMPLTIRSVVSLHTRPAQDEPQATILDKPMNFIKQQRDFLNLVQDDRLGKFGLVPGKKLLPKP
jgi:hypothetical protein